MEPIKKKRIYEYVIERVKVAIETGELKPGDKLPSEREMAKMLNVSRAAIREALSVMETAGMLEIKTGIGVFLIEDHLENLIDRINILLVSKGFQIVEVLELRQGIESQAAYLAAQRATEKEIIEIKKALSELSKAVETGTIATHEDYYFHLAIVNASKNVLIKHMTSSIADHFIDGLNKSREESLLAGRSARIFQEHVEIYEAIRDRKPDLASKKMWEHLEKVRVRFVNQTSLQGGGQS